MTTHLTAPGSGLTVCCSQSPFELPLMDRLTVDPAIRDCNRQPPAQGCRYPNLDKGDGEGCGESTCPIHGVNDCPECQINTDGYSLAHTHADRTMVACAPLRCPGCQNCPFMSED